MCGIAGIVSTHNRDLGPLIHKMLRSMDHRRPDGALKGHVALGHVRLAITRGITGMQLFCSDNGRFTLLHNGEIYNYRAVAEQIGRERALETGSDTEVILKLLEQEYAGDLELAVERVLP